ncbi:MAG: DUF5131 family protein [Chthoniobacteraceae bacterium]
MSAHTNIPWCDSTVNPTSGCDGCELWNGRKRTCYAGTWQETRASRNPAFAHLYAPNFNEVRMIPGRVREAMSWSDLRGVDRADKPWLNGRPRHIFVGDLSDIFSRAVDFEYLLREVIEPFRGERGQRHVGMVLTKRPVRLVEFAEWLKEDRGIVWPANVMAMTTITSQATARTRIKALAQFFDVAPIARLMVSAEPLLEAVDLLACEGFEKMDGVIVGGESGAGAEPCEFDWLGGVIGACRAFGTEIKCFVKQAGSRAGLRDRKGEDMSEWPERLRVRELPEVAE